MGSKKTRGISSILGTVIVVAITVALGALLYTYATGMFNTLTQTTNVNAQAQIIVNPSTNQAYLEYTLQNNGNIEVNISAIIIGNETIHTNILLVPGNSLSNVTILHGNFTIGAYYTVVFVGENTAHKPFTEALNVLASES